MYQVGKGSIKQIPLSARDLKILEQHGWVFIDYTTLSPYCLGPALSRHYTCVGFAKHILEIRDPFIITPDQLYKKLAHGAQRLEY